MSARFRVYPSNALEAVEVRDLWSMFMDVGPDLIEAETKKYEALAYGRINPDETVRFAINACKLFLHRSRIVLWEVDVWEVAISGYRTLANRQITEAFLNEAPTDFDTPLLWFWRGKVMSERNGYRRIGEIVFPSMSTVDGAKQMSTLGLVFSPNYSPAIAYTQGPSVGERYPTTADHAVQQAAAIMFMQLPTVNQEALSFPRQARRAAERKGNSLPHVYTVKSRC